MYNIRDIGGDPWICVEEHPVVRLSGGHAAVIMDTAEKLQQAKSWGQLGWYLGGIVNGTLMTVLEGGAAVRADPIPLTQDLGTG